MAAWGLVVDEDVGYGVVEGLRRSEVGGHAGQTGHIAGEGGRAVGDVDFNGGLLGGCGGGDGEGDGVGGGECPRAGPDDC